VLRFILFAVVPAPRTTDLFELSAGGRVLICPGCGGRNDPAARACEWCARPFVVEHRRIPVLWIVGSAMAAFTVLALAVLMFALVSVLRARVDQLGLVETPGFTAVEPTALPEPTELALSEPTATPEPLPTETPVPTVEFFQIGNTGGTGAFIRREPRANAPGIVALRDGLPVKVVGPDETVNGRVWRNVEDRNGNRGWTPRDYLVPTQQQF
jgi:hypothetical protein